MSCKVYRPFTPKSDPMADAMFELWRFLGTWCNRRMDAVATREAAVGQPKGSQTLHRLLMTQSFK